MNISIGIVLALALNAAIANKSLWVFATILVALTLALIIIALRALR